MVAKNNQGSSSWAFIVGIIIALILGLVGSVMGDVASGWLLSLLIVLGLIVGFTNVAGKESKDFLLAAVALVIIAFAGGQLGGQLINVNFVGPYLQDIFYGLLAFIVPAGIVVALKDIWAISYK